MSRHLGVPMLFLSLRNPTAFRWCLPLLGLPQMHHTLGRQTPIHPIQRLHFWKCPTLPLPHARGRLFTAGRQGDQECCGAEHPGSTGNKRGLSLQPPPPLRPGFSVLSLERPVLPTCQPKSNSQHKWPDLVSAAPAPPADFCSTAACLSPCGLGMYSLTPLSAFCASKENLHRAARNSG